MFITIFGWESRFLRGSHGGPIPFELLWAPTGGKYLGTDIIATRLENDATIYFIRAHRLVSQILDRMCFPLATTTSVYMDNEFHGGHGGRPGHGLASA